MSARTYDDIAPSYDKAMRPLDRWLLAPLRATTLRYLPKQGRILEIGAGTGRNFHLYPATASVIATEPSAGMLHEAIGKERPGTTQLVQSGAEQLPFADQTFDAAFATLVFCSLDEPHEAFSELRRVVRAGGIIVLLEHVRPPGLLGPVFDFLNLLSEPLCDDHFNRRTARAAKAAGLKDVTIEEKCLGIINIIAGRV
jgi:ubiquinone/menaquinone biosynthesis C-methylase UbiE